MESYQLKRSNNQKEKKKKKITFFFLNDFKVDQVNVFFGVALSPFSDKKAKSTTKIIIRYLLFDNFGRLTYPNYVFLINNLVMLKYAILVLEQDS